MAALTPLGTKPVVPAAPVSTSREPALRPRRRIALAVVWRGLVLTVAALYFGGPALAAFWFSVHNDRTGIEFHAYTGFFTATGFQPAFRSSVVLGLTTVVLATLLMVPAMLLAHLRHPGAKRWLELASLLPLGWSSHRWPSLWAYATSSPSAAVTPGSTRRCPGSSAPCRVTRRFC